MCKQAICHPERPHYGLNLCRPCYSKRWRDAHPDYGKRHYEQNKDTQLEQGRAWYRANRESRLAHTKQYRKDHPDIHRNRQLKRMYGITINRYHEILQEQNNACKLCGTSPPNRPVVEHCHKTGNVRGITCQRCNIAIGAFEAYGPLFDAIAKYLEDSCKQ